MMSERVFSTSFPGFWDEVLPLLTPGLVGILNINYRVKSFSVLTEGESQEVESVPGVGHSALVSEVAFNLARLATWRAMEVLQAFDDPELIREAVKLASFTVSSSHEEDPEVELSEPERRDILDLLHSYKTFFRARAHQGPIVFGPSIPGAGFLPTCEADICIGDTLYEVKTVKRGIASKDIRQLLIYLALQASTGERRWFKAGFFNPRRAVLHEFPVDDLILRISGGRAPAEVFREVIDFVQSRETGDEGAF